MSDSGLLKTLNIAQKQAVTHEDGPLLIVAGAGTGKTTVITSKIAWLVMEQGIKPEEILALTFTEKAAAEMEERVDKLLPLGYADLWISTFHSFAERILKDHALDIGLSDNFKLLSGTEQWLLVRQNLDKFNLDYYRPLGNPTKFIHSLLKLFSRAKDEEVYPEDYLKYAEELRLNSDSAEFLRTYLSAEEIKKLPPAEAKALLAEEILRQQEIADAYHTYQRLLLENNALDFGDLINYLLKLFKTRKNVLAKYRAQFKYILVDEFQDTNWAQYELVKLLAEPKNNLTVVGDDDQCLPGSSKVLTDKGLRRIDSIKEGDQVLSAVGRSSVGYYPVTKVFKNKKSAKLITITTSSGKKITVTDNHKMFCLTPAIGDKKYYYVYLMQRIGLGWRIGITNDLSARLRLERSADRIIGLKACESETEARFFETFYSLQYKIPTVCFQPRKGVAIKDEWLTKLYQAVNTEKSVANLAADLNIDLMSHHYCLAAVNRGGKLRIKINLEICHRRYHSKNIGILKAPKISHLLSIETSDAIIIKKLAKAGFLLKKTKQGGRLRILSQNLSELGALAVKIEKLTGGIIENFAILGKINKQSRKALVLPAKNILLGNYLPIISGKKIIYEEVVKINKSKPITKTVYDLEVSGPHNFCADGVIVHNSIYKFRGASISNIMQFKDDFPKAKEILLTDNYRSSQKILDLAYNFIQNNNPNRLEVKLSVKGKKLSKKLTSHYPLNGLVEHLFGHSLADEVEMTVNKIIDLYNADKDTNWSDFAILVRANNSAEEFIKALALAKVPYLFLANKGLYRLPLILDVLSWFRCLDDYHENSSMYRILNFPVWEINHEDIVNINYWAYRKGFSIFEICRQNSLYGNLSAEARKKIAVILALLDKHAALVKSGQKPSELLTEFLTASNYLKRLTQTDSLANREQLNALNLFLKKILDFEKDYPQPTLKEFMALIDMELESGESGGLKQNLEDLSPDTVKVMTIHGSKGLEFKYVFIANLVDRKFPTTTKSDLIELPEKLTKEIIPEGDIHLQEERRLFYVAMTRAKEGLFLSSALDYGGAQKKKPSRFLIELSEVGFDLNPEALITAPPIESIDSEQKSIKHSQNIQALAQATLPKTFSFTQLAAFAKCPYQYRFAHILKIPTIGKSQFSFGKTMHSVMQKFFILAQNKSGLGQNDLFGEKNKLAQPLVWDEVKKLYEDLFIDDWYNNRKQRDEYYDKGLKSLKNFFESWQKNPHLAQQLEYGFTFKLGRGYSLRGAIDRIDSDGEGIKLIDYKTGSPKKKLEAEDKEQLLIYQMAAEEILKQKVTSLTFYYFDNNESLSFLGKPVEIEKLKEKIINQIEEIKEGKFPPRPAEHTCKYCDFKNICDFAV